MLFVLIILMSGLCHAGNLTQVEEKISKTAKESTQDAIAFLERTVNINSGTMNHEGVAEVGKLFAKEFESIGFQVKWIPMKEVGRSGHLFAERNGTKGKRLLLIGHLDTVFEKESSFEPYKRSGNRATGQGVNDMKGGDVIALYALKALHQAGALENTSIIVAFTGDEEMSGDPMDVSRKDLLEAANRSDIALGFESAEGLNTGTIARRGISGWTLKVKGIQAHSSGIFTEQSGYGAVFEAARILNAFRQELAGEKHLTFSPGVIVGGTEVTYNSELSSGTAFGKTNVISRTAVVAGDIRCISNEQEEHARERMMKIVSQSLPGTTAEISFDKGYPGMAPKEGNWKLLKFFDQVSRDLGYSPIEPFDPDKRGAADISHVSEKLDCLDGLGAMGNGGHTPEEDIDLDAIPVLLQRAAVLIYRLTNTDLYR